MPFGIELRRDRSHRKTSGLCGFAPQLAHPGDHGAFGGKGTIRLRALHTLTSRATTLPRRSQLQNEDVLLEPCDRTKNLANEAACWIVAAGEVYAVCGQDAGSDSRELPEDNFLDHQITSQPIGPFHDDGPHAVAFQHRIV